MSRSDGLTRVLVSSGNMIRVKDDPEDVLLILGTPGPEFVELAGRQNPVWVRRSEIIAVEQEGAGRSMESLAPPR